ncbi:YopX protein [Campylobacter insulaenigrae]|uniref:YopX family protein n=1 Tax=Campylobacter insulaenigrae TaxID=260714 RepID=UPI000F6DC2A2|nr:YopX family protein [Campylobacter insulaenigrae]MCR6590507.1 YopX family protein [Campylobacter insulaenigrae]MCR6592044.1 YopX family protein [Campylobacter insulaenigrae]VEJ53321.1 YopX protein [Campylobacter insulaenigrae]
MKLKDFDFRIWDWNNKKYVDETYQENYNCVGIVRWFKNFLGETEDFNKKKFFEFQFFNKDEGDCGGFSVTGNVEIELWTGYYDKNGKKIFEGDIINNPYLNELYIVVRDKFNMIRLECYHLFDEKYEREDKNLEVSFLYIYPSKQKMEVIGNIHENPELLKGE